MKNLKVFILFIGAIVLSNHYSSAQCCEFSQYVEYDIGNTGIYTPIATDLNGDYLIDLDDVFDDSSVIIRFRMTNVSGCPAGNISGDFDGWQLACGLVDNTVVTWTFFDGAVPPFIPGTFNLPVGASTNTYTATVDVAAGFDILKEGTYCRELEFPFVRPDAAGGTCNDALVIKVSANVKLKKPIINFDPASPVQVGVVDEGTSASQPLTIENAGELDLEISAFNTIEVVGNWSNFPTAPQTITPSGDYIINPTITADTDLTVEAVYRLVIDIVSNDANSPHQIQFDATGQPIISNFEISPSVSIAFSPVVLPGFGTEDLILSNNILAGVTQLDAEYKIEALDGSDPDWAYFEFNDGGTPLSLPVSTTSLTVGDTKTFTINFQPDDLATYSVAIKISSRDAGAVTFSDEQVIVITGTGTTQTTDFVLVLDKSGSMNQPAGEVIKMEAMQNATGYFLDLLLSEAQNYDQVDYRFGIVQFGTNNQMLYPGSPGMADVAVDGISIDAAKIEVDNLNAGGWTCIQDAMITAEGLLSDPLDIANNKAVLVLSDGNETPLPAQGDCTEALPALGADSYAEEIDFFSIGLGEGTNFSQGNLDQIMSYGSGTGFSQITYNLKDANVFQLFKAYQEVFRIVTGKQGVDPTYYREIDEALEVAIKINSLDQNATFTFVGELPIEAYKIEIFTPGGSRVYPEVDSAVVRSKNWLIFNANYERLGIEDDYVGNWILRAKVENVKQWINDPVFEDGPSHRMMIGSFGNSSYELQTEVSTDNLSSGDPLVIRTTLTEKGIASLDATVMASITAPNKKKHQIQLYDDGLHSDEKANDGIYGAVFTNTFDRGNYAIDIQSQGLTRKGERVDRMESFSKFIGKITPYEKVVKPASNIYIYLLLAIVLVLLLMLWLRVRKS